MKQRHVETPVNPYLIGMKEAELLDNLKDPHFRLRHLYWITDKNSKLCLFRPNEVQERFLAELHYRNVVPKARQRGFSTCWQIVMLDACVFVENQNTAIIAQDLQKAREIRDTKVIFAWDRLPQIIHEANPLVVDNVEMLKWSNDSRMSVSTSARSGTLQYLHISEYGKICAIYPENAREIMTGSLPTVDQNGIIVIESTAEGKEGDFYDKVMIAKANQEKGKPLTKLDYRLHFASWWDADEYETDPEHVHITEADHKYFDRKEGEIGRKIGPRKRAWYVNKRDADFSGDEEMMWQEYPTTLEEAFQVSSEGVYLANQLSLARRQGRITKVPYDPTLPVHTWWDLGVDDDVAIWFMQQSGPRSHFIDYFEGSGEPYSFFVRALRDKPYVYGKTFLPHDGAHRRPGAEQIKTIAEMLADLGVRDIEIVPRADDLINAIQQLREGFGTYWFDEVNCKTGLTRLEGYRKSWNRTQQVWNSTPANNGNQHAADALRQRAQWGGIIGAGAGMARPKRRNTGGMAA